MGLTVRLVRLTVNQVCSELAVAHELLFKVKELALEARIRIDHASLLLDMTHRLEQTPLLLLHQIGNDTSCRSRLASVTVKRNCKR